MHELNLQINTAVPYSERPNTPAPLMPGKIPESVKQQRLLSLRGTIAEMKRAEFGRRMAQVESVRRQHVLDLIALAESIHVDDFASGAADVVTTHQAEMSVN